MVVISFGNKGKNIINLRKTECC